MKKFTLIVLLALLISACKKSSTAPTIAGAPFQVRVSGLTSLTALNLTVVDVTQNDVIIMSLIDEYGNRTYSTTQNVNPGDHLMITITDNVDEDIYGDGEGTIEFYYKGVQEGNHTGAINISGFTTTETMP